MSNDRRNVGQLPLDFGAMDSVSQSHHAIFCTKIAEFTHLALVVDNSAMLSQRKNILDTNLEPNSPEITNIIRSLGKSLSW